MSYTENAIKMMSASIPAEQPVSDQPCTNTIIFELRKQFISRVDTATVASGSKNYLKARFETPLNDWCKPITAIFDSYTVLLDDNNECFIPWKALSTPHTMAVSAFSADLHTATVTLVEIEPSGYIPGETPEPPTPDVYAQLIQTAQNAVDIAQSVRDDADAGAFDGPPGPQGPKGDLTIDDTQASPDNPWSGAKVDQEVKQLSEQIEKVNKEVADAREGYFGEQYDSLCERIDGDINNVLDKVNVMAYEGTSFHATNTYARNLNVNRNKVEILGQTIQNCLDHSSVDKFGLLNGIVSDGWIEISADGNFKNFRTLTDSVVAKPNTKYTFVVEVAEQSLQTGSGSYICFGETGAEANQPSLFVDQKIFMASNPLRVGINKFVLTTKSNFDGVFCADRGFISSSVISGSIKFRYMIIEGDWTNKDISWVPFGLNTPQTTEVKIVGRNLAKSFYPKVPTAAWEPAIIVDANFEPSTKYLLYVEGTGDGAFYPNEYLFKEYIDFGVGNPIVLTTLDTFSKNDPRVFNAQNGRYILAKNRCANTGATITKVLVERYDGDMDAAYVDYVENTVTINSPLGSVPDTAWDRVYLKDGKAYYEQNVASAVFDGSEDENWSAYTQQGMPNTYICTGTLGQIGKVAIPFSCISDRYARKYNFTMQNNGVANGAKDIVIRDDNYTTVENFVNYLQGYPITVIYQLATPITTEIQLSDFYSYEEQTNWYTTNAVKPTLKAEIPSNIGAVVSSTIAENAALRQENAELSQQVAALSEELQVSKILLGVE